MKKIYSVIAMAMFAMGINAQVTYDFTTVAPAPADGGGIVLRGHHCIDGHHTGTVCDLFCFPDMPPKHH